MSTRRNQKHFWILEVNAEDERYQWRAEATGRGGLDIVAYRTKKEAAADLYDRGMIYGKARLVKYIPVGAGNEHRG